MKKLAKRIAAMTLGVTSFFGFYTVVFMQLGTNATLVAAGVASICLGISFVIAERN